MQKPPTFGSKSTEEKAPLFGSKSTEGKAPLFGSKSTEGKAPLFGSKSTEVKAPLFGSKSSTEEKAPLFGSKSTEGKAPLFGSKSTEGKPPLFGSGTSTPLFQSTGSAPLFGTSNSTPLFSDTPNTTNLFGGAAQQPWTPALANAEDAAAKEEAEAAEEEEDEDTATVQLAEGETLLAEEPIKFKFIGFKLDENGAETDKEWKSAGEKKLLVTEIESKVRFMVTNIGGASRIFVNAYKSHIMDIKAVKNKQGEAKMLALSCIGEEGLKQYKFIFSTVEGAAKVQELLKKD